LTEVMQGIRVLEVAEQTFVPAASALLAEWGAEVIKVEHVERGDSQRGLASTGTVKLGEGPHVIFQHSNRGKKSLGLDLTAKEGVDILYRLATTCDVFLTNKLPSVRSKLRIDLDDIRAHNPSIVYVRGTGHGERGPDANRGSYDLLAYWSRAGIAMSQKYAEDDRPPPPPAPSFGDSICAMAIAGGIMGALFHRERTGEATTVDVSLLGVGLWSMGSAVALSLRDKVPWGQRPKNEPRRNPLVMTYETKDGRFIALTCLQAAKYWVEACGVIGLLELATDERFANAKSIEANAPQAIAFLAGAFAKHTAAEWRERLQGFSGQWAMVQDTLEAAADPQTVANGYVQEYKAPDGVRFRLASPPVQYGGVPATPRRAPEFNEHGDAILAALGLEWDAIVDLKVRGIVA
jgi:crotonobetainyl-CoA:carnitine CoA-transferase CaiB-like acyl-CoA transferase